MINILMRRVMHFEDWRKVGGAFVHQRQSGLMFGNTDKNYTVLKVK